MSNLKLKVEPFPRLEISRGSDVRIHDDFLSRQSQERVLNVLQAPGWAFGAYSDPEPGSSRYWYKHFAGYVKDGREPMTASQIEAELERNAPVLVGMWRIIKATVLTDHQLARCYVNGYPFGSEGGLHCDSDVDTHYTALYHPHLEWRPGYAGETVFFNRDGTEILASVYPKPNRLVVFPGVIPHIARGVTRSCPELRMTLMFKTTGPATIAS